MTTEAQEQMTAEQIAAADAAAEAAFAEGYGSEEDDGDSPAPAPAAATTSEEAPETSPAEPETPPAPALTAEQVQQELAALRDTTATELRKLFGKLGEVGGSIQELRKTRQAGPVKLPEGGLKRMAAEFPEMAKYLQDDLADVLSQLGQGPAATDPDELGQMLQPRFEETLSEVDKRVERRLLKRDHPDWETVVHSEDFKEWKKTLPPKEAAELDESWDADFIGSKITAHKLYLKEKAEKAAAKERRLEDAIVPTNSRRPPPAASQDIEEAFEEGFYGKKQA